MDLVIEIILMVMVKIHFATPCLFQILYMLYREERVSGLTRPVEKPTLNIFGSAHVSDGAAMTLEELVDAPCV